jgi:hypothetical protein
MRWIAAALLLSATPAHSQSMAQWLGPKMLFGFYDEGPERSTMATVLEDIKGKPGIDGVILERAARIQRLLASRETRIAPTFYNRAGWEHWLDIYAQDFTLVDADGRPWHPYKFLEPEISLSLMALGFWYCDNHDRDMPDAECYRMDVEAKALYERISGRALKP